MVKTSHKLISALLTIAIIASCLTVLGVSNIFVANAAAGDKIYCETTQGTPNCYMWNGSGSSAVNNAAWPGVPMTKEKDNIYSYTLPAAYENVIFSIGGNQTDDLTYPGNNQKYNFATGVWSVYDTSSAKPVISISKKDGASFTSDTMDVTISAEYADTASYKIDNGSYISFTGSKTVTMGAGLAVNSYTVLTVTAQNANGTETVSCQYLKKDPSSSSNHGDGSTTEALTGKYGTNPDGKVGKKATITIDGEFSDWSDDMLIAQGAAWDVANHWKGGHENCVLDTYALYGAWDEDNLYIAWQMVNTTDTWARSGDGPLSDGGRVLDVPLILALSIDQSSPSMTNKNTTGGSIWGQKMGLEFTTHVDRLLYMSGKPGLGEPSIFKAADEQGNTAYTAPYCVGFSKGGISYKMKEGFLPSSLIGLNYSNSPDDVFDDSADWVDYMTFTGSAGKHDTTYDSFYEIKIPLDLLDIDAGYIAQNGIGAMLVATRGESALDCIPYDPSMIDNAEGSYSSDPSTSLEKEDIDNITVPFARIGKLSSGNTNPTTPTTPPATVPPTEESTQNTTGATTPATTAPATTSPVITDPATTDPANPVQPTLYGDVNLDGDVSIKDVTILQQYLASKITLNAQQLANAKVTKDGAIDIRAATLIQRYIASLITKFPVEE